MSKLEAAIAHIEAVTGREYGEWPREMGKKEHKLKEKKSYCKAVLPGFKTLSWTLHKLFGGYEHASHYYRSEHAITISTEEEKLVGHFAWRHECAHAFQRNHWPELYAASKTKEERYVHIGVKEGIADYIAINPESQEQVTELTRLRGNILDRTRVKTFLENKSGLIHVDELRVNWNSRYALGLALAEAAVAEAGEVWTGLDNLAKNPPRTIDEAYDRIEVARDA